MNLGNRAACIAALLLATPLVLAQSPGSVESELIYAQEYLDAGKWDYAMWRYEAILRREPGNAEAKAGYERAKSGYKDKLAAEQTQAARMAPARPTGPVSRPPAQRAAPARRVSSGQQHCDDLFGTCWVTSKSPNCFVQKNMCYVQNGIPR